MRRDPTTRWVLVTRAHLSVLDCPFREELEQLSSNRILVAVRLTCEMTTDFHDNGGRGEGRGHTPANPVLLDFILAGHRQLSSCSPPVNATSGVPPRLTKLRLTTSRIHEKQSTSWQPPGRHLKLDAQGIPAPIGLILVPRID